MADRKTCSSAILEAFPDLKKPAVDAILEEMENIRSKIFTENKNLSGPEFRKKVGQFLEERRFQQAAARREVADNILKNHKLMAFATQDAFHGDPVEAVKAKLGGTARYSKEGNFSVGSMTSNLRTEGMSQLWGALKEAGDGIEEIAKKGLLDRETAQALWEMRKGGDLTKVKSQEAIKIAKIYKTVNDGVLQNKQLSGSAVRNLDGYITSQSHSPEKIQAAAFDQWFADILPKLNQEKSFGPGATSEKIKASLEETFKEIISGQHDRPTADGVSDQFITVHGQSANISKKTSQARSLHFVDGDASFEYNQKYGERTLLESVQQNVITSARQSALMYNFGTNPEGAYNGWKARIRSEYKNTPDALKKFNENESTLDSWFKSAQGFGTMPGTSIAARAGQNARAIVSMSRLGTSVLRAISDTAYGISTLRAGNGKNIFENASNVMGEFFKNMSSTERVKWAGRLGTAIDDFHGHMYAEMGAAGPTQPGQMAKMQRLLGKITSNETQEMFMKASLHTLRSDAAKVAMSKQLAMELADHAATPFNGLSDRVKLNLERYGINEGDWKHISRATETYDKGAQAVTPEGVDNIPAELFGENGEKKKFEIKQKLLSYLNDQANMGANQPGLRQSATLIRGTSDEGVGIIYRLLAQFKQVPLMAFDTSKRVMLSNPVTQPKTAAEALLKWKGDMSGFAQHMAMATVLGYVGMAAKDMAQGKTPRDATDHKVALEAMVQGGAGGLYGDFMFGEFGRNRSAADSILGPVLGQGADLADLWAKARDGKAKAGDGLHILMNNVPFQNLFYTKHALDYLIMNHVNEMFTPGHNKRAEDATHKNPGLFDEHQGYFMGSPTGDNQ